jgi:hypothetical protein
MFNTPQTPIVIRARHNIEETPLKAPDVPVAIHDDDNLGLIPISELTAPLVMALEVWQAATSNQTYQLVWDGKRTGPEVFILDTDKPGDIVTLEIPVELLAEGSHSAGYRTWSATSEFENLSETFPVIIDRTAPGRPDLSALHFPVEVQNGLTAAELLQLGNKLDAEVAGYTGMAKHDFIQSYWGSVKGPSANVTEDDMGLNKVMMTFSSDFLKTIEAGSHPVRYQVTDRAGNISQFSLSVDILLLLEEIPTDYPAPLLDPAIGDLIDYSEARFGVQVDIPHYLGAAAFDQITLYWGEGRPMLPVQLTPGNENDDIVLSVRVPYETVALQPIGVVSISYTVMRQNQMSGSSLPTVVNVFLTLPIPEPASPPVVQGTSVQNPNITDNFIDEDDYELNARAIIKWSAEFKVSDDLNLLWGEQQRLQWYQIKEEDVLAGEDLIIPVANSIIKAQGTGAEIPVRYSVARAGNPNLTLSVTQQVTVRSTEELPGGADGIDGPAFKVTGAGYISLVTAPNGADGRIDPYTNIAENQKLFFNFKGFDENNNPIDAATYTATRELDDIDVEQGYSFTVPFINLRTICFGFCEAYIRVEPAAGSNQSAVTSKVTRLPVEMRETTELVCPIRSH